MSALAVLVVIEDAGHVPLLTRPHEVVEALQDWWSRVSADEVDSGVTRFGDGCAPRYASGQVQRPPPRSRMP